MTGQDLRVNPYVGLRPFFEDDCLYFFGRDQQTAELLEILRQHRFLGVVGSSGSGKSSLVRAGLLPGLLGGFLVQDRDRWRTVQIKPGDAPICNLAVGLLKAMGQTPTPEDGAALERDIRERHTAGVIEFLTRRLESNANVFLLVDQFEEIFAFRGIQDDDSETSLDLARRKERAQRKAEAADFVDLLLALAGQRDLPIYVVLTMRTDFLGDCDLFYGLPEALNRGRYLVPRMTREQLRDAVECPALLLEAGIAPRLLDHLLNELGDRFDRLPVLQHALLRTWDEWQRAGGIGPVDLQYYELAGGLEHALDKDAEEALKGLDIGIAARVFQRLTDTDLSQRRVRSPARMSELMTASGADRGTVEGIVRRFEEGGRSFVHASDDGKPDDPRVDISHESLIRQWVRLRNWVDEERRSRDEYKELAARSRKKARALLQDPELQMLIDWKATVALSSGWAQRYSSADGDFECAARYLDESVEERCRNRAEAELQRRWTTLWSPLLMAIEVGVGLRLAQKADLLRDTSKNLLADTTKLVGSAKSARWAAVSEFFDIFGHKEFFYILAFLAACVGLNLCAKAAYRRFAYNKLLRSAVSSGQRRRIEVQPQAAELRDAVVVHDTTYAPTYRRIAGFLIDVALLFVFGFFALLVLSSANGFEANDAVMSMWFPVCLVFSWLYSTLQIASKRQATLGMRAVRIFRTDLHGQRLSFGRASAWYVYRLLTSSVYGIQFLIQPFTRKRQTFSDWLAKTVVLRRPSPPSAAAASLAGQVPAV